MRITHKSIDRVACWFVVLFGMATCNTALALIQGQLELAACLSGGGVLGILVCYHISNWAINRQHTVRWRGEASDSAIEFVHPSQWLPSIMRYVFK